MRTQEIDEESGFIAPCNGATDVSSSGVEGKDDFDASSPPPRRSIHSDGSDLQRYDSSFSAQSSSDDINHKDECDDHVSEMTPLIALTGDRAATELSLQIPRPIRRSLSEESIATVSALPGMVLRAHSIHVGAAGRHSEVTCSIRPSSTKAALKAVQQERRASRRRQEQQNSK